MAKNTSLFEFKLDLLKDELNTIGESIRKLDDASLQIKNWAILVWAGSMSLILGSKETDLRKLLFFDAAIPLLFWLVDGNCRRRQRHFIFRNKEITQYINGPEFMSAFETKSLDDFGLLSIMAGHNESDAVKSFTSLRKTMWFVSLRTFYLGLIIITLILQIVIYPRRSSVMPTAKSNRPDSTMIYQQTQILKEVIRLNRSIDSLLSSNKIKGTKH